MDQKSYKPLVLVVMDGLGVSAQDEANAVFLANKPTLDMFDAEYPFTTLQASGVAVGLPWGEKGNSEVGHLTMGAGRVIYNHLPRIIYSIHDKSFYQNETFLKAAEHVKKNNSKLHILGLVSSGSVHSHIDHLSAVLRFIEEQKIPQAYLHAITDGKDALPKEGEKFLPALESRMAREFPHTLLASVIGRYYAMDRDENWERTEKAYQLLTSGAGVKIEGGVGPYLRSLYNEGITDVFIGLSFVAAKNGEPLA